MIEIKKADSKKDRASFVDFPHDLYSDDPNYVPELHIAQRDLLDPNHHPFHKHSKLQLFLAFREGKIVGRIAAIRNNNHIKFTGKNEGFFGFFDCENNQDTANALLDAASGWLKSEGIKDMIGPANFSTNETCGMLIEGYDSPPVVMMTYNKPYYNDLVKQYGMVKKMDLFAWKLTADKVSEKSLRISEAIEKRLLTRGITIRKANMKDFKSEVEQLIPIYNSAWDKNWGFVPMTDEEFRYMAKDMKMVLDPDLVLVAELKGKIIGFSLTLPDVNFALHKVKRGRLLPTGLFKLLYYKNKTKMVRVVALGILEQYRKLGIEACFYARTIKSCRTKNIDSAEASWILENNTMMNNGIQNLQGEVYKKYRIYEKAL